MIKVNWDTSRTDIPIFDNSIFDSRNPHRDFNMRLKWISPQRYIEYQYEIIEQFRHYETDRTGIESFWKFLRREDVNEIKDAIKEGEHFYAFVLEFDKIGNLVSMQEGRHRAVAMMELGIKRIPVYFAYKRYEDKAKIFTLDEAEPLL